MTSAYVEIKRDYAIMFPMLGGYFLVVKKPHIDKLLELGWIEPIETGDGEQWKFQATSKYQFYL